MSEETKTTKATRNRRDWIKNAAIVFLALMLVLTLFSNSFMNYSLPEVSTQYVMSGTITSKVRGTGSVVASDPYLVEALNNQLGRKIASVPVKVGDTVEKGTVLYILEEGDSQELKDAQEALKAEEKALENMVAAYQQSIISGSVPADAVYSVEDGSAESFAESLAKLAAKEQEIENVKRTISSYEQQLASLNAELKQLNSKYPNSYETGWATAQVNSLEAELAAARAYFDQAGDKVNEAQAALDAANAELQEAKEVGKTEEELAPLREKADNAEAALTEAQEARADLDGIIAEYPGKIDYWRAYMQKDEVAGKIDTVEANMAAAQDSISRLNEECNEMRQSFGYVQQLEQSLGDIEEQRAKVAEQREVVEKLQSGAAGIEVVAPVSGTVTALTYRAGETINDTNLGTIQLTGKECTMSISVTADQAKALRVGDVADIQNSWYYSGVSAVISAIRTDPGNPQSNKLIVFTVTGDVMDGQSLSVSVGQKSAEYSLTVPNSAIREDNNGKFILIVEYKSSPLGTRYVATRVDVEVLASDDTRSAISAALNGYEYVITTANKPVEPGQLIRLSSN